MERSSSEGLRLADGMDRRFHVCPVCGTRKITFAFPVLGQRMERCTQCKLLLINPQPIYKDLIEIYQQSDIFRRKDDQSCSNSAPLKSSEARILLDAVCDYFAANDQRGKQIINIGCGNASLRSEAETRGFELTQMEFWDQVMGQEASQSEQTLKCELGDKIVKLPEGGYDVCILEATLDRVRNPSDLLDLARNILKPRGVLAISTDLLDDSLNSQRKRRTKFRLNRLFYFNKTNLQTLLYKSGFSAIKMYPSGRWKKPDLPQNYETEIPEGVQSRVFWLKRIKNYLRDKLFSSDFESILTVAIKNPNGKGKLSRLSVILPVYQEKETFPILIKRLVEMDLSDLDMEIIIIESNSKDGTREEVLKLKDHPKVKVVLQDGPRGKGNAVREGLGHASGDIILIQDGDLEYDLWDYEALLQPIVELRRSFTLGRRHGAGSLTMRQYNNKRMSAWFINIGHRVMTFTFNSLYDQNIRDPWTMFKVFRRDCIRGIDFKCDHFDFDVELVIRLIQQGFVPVEIPVSYHSRSYAEGKKVSILLDPIRIAKVMLKHRFGRGK